MITPEDRNVDFLKETVKGVYRAVYETHQIICSTYGIDTCLPETLHFATTDDLIKQYPNATPKERENIICKEHGAVFLIGIGGWKADGELRHVSIHFMYFHFFNGQPRIF